ncbi:hypothetical protein [Herbidospora daliensis]|uniref:hypothetical protein n=1 Tax=Herbidospora daliensis TaxID=295585 RepID=UPI000AF31584|nr:hypothetical protein [Herbidospora daliensis]
MTDRAAIWAAIHTNLTGRDHGSHKATIHRATQATGCTAKEAWDVLTAATRAGWLTSTTIRRPGRRSYRRIALTDKAPAPTEKAST